MFVPDVVAALDRENVRYAIVGGLAVNLDRRSLQVASLDDLVAMKRAAGRPQDLADIEHLERGRGGRQ